MPVSEMTYTVSSGTLNSTIPYHTASQSFALLLTNSDVNKTILQDQDQDLQKDQNLQPMPTKIGTIPWYGILEYNVPLDTV